MITSTKSRPRALAGLAALVIAAVLMLQCVPTPARVGGPPNVLVLFMDDMAFADMSRMGNRECPTPNLDSIARNGVLFRNGYSVSCVCSPSRVAMLTGRYPQRFGFEANTDIGPEPRPAERLDPTARLFPSFLQERGYATGMVGKWHIGSHAPEQRPNARGFQEFYGILPHAIETANGPAQVWRNLEPAPRPADHTQAFGQEARNFIARHASEPWFLYCAFTAMHSPYESPRSYQKRFEHSSRPQYLGMLACLDDTVGEILDELRRQGLEENTLIFLTSDNGGEGKGDNGPLRGKKWLLLEGGIRAPLMVQWKGHLPAGVERDELVSQLDCLPTALAAAGAEPDPALHLDGANLLPLMTGATETAPHDALFWRFGPQFAARAGGWKLVKAGLEAPVALYDLERDPHEDHDLVREEPERAEDLRRRWEEWNRDNLPPHWNDSRWNGIEAPAPAPGAVRPPGTAR